MRSIKAIFVKQARDALKNKGVLIQFLIFPIMAYIMTEMVAKPSEDIPNTIYVTMFAAMFAGMTPLVMTAISIAEDREYKSLRFLAMAGVKPYEYLLGVGGFVLFVCALVSVVFSLIGGFVGMEMLRFVSALIIGSGASMLLGASIGILSKNQQSATAISTPIFMILAFVPMLALFNETLQKVAGVLYTQQINEIVGGLSFEAINNATAEVGEMVSEASVDVTKAYLIILANVAVFLILFVFAYKKKGLRN